MSKDRPKYLHVKVFLNEQEEPEEFWRITDIKEAADYDMLELYRDKARVGFFAKADVKFMEVKADA